MKVLAVVPARCGSKGFPNKNIAEINGKTLIDYAVEVGRKCSLVDDVYISTDCEKYESIGINAGAKSLGLRSKELSSDNAKSIDVIIDLVNKLEKKYDYLVLLQPTSPIRSDQDISNMLNTIEKEDVAASVSVSIFEEPHPYKLKAIEDGFIKSFIDGTTSEVPRQSLPKVYALNGALYVIKIDSLLKNNTFLPEKTIPYIMESNINIDSEEDFIFLEAMVKRGKISL